MRRGFYQALIAWLLVVHPLWGVYGLLAVGRARSFAAAHPEFTAGEAGAFVGLGVQPLAAIGRWRDQDGGATIDASGSLPGGDSFNGPADLKALLKTRSDEFARTLTENLMTYALGRGLEYFDRCAVDRILADLDRHDSRFGRLVVDIVTSDAFRMRKNEGGE